MRHYETLYIVNPDLSDEDYKEVLNKFSQLIEKKKGVLIKVDEWGKQKLAYEVKKFDRGAYVLMDYCGGSGITGELERDMKLDDKVLKYQTVKLGDVVDPQELIDREEESKKQRATQVDEDSKREEEQEQESEPVRFVDSGGQGLVH